MKKRNLTAKDGCFRSNPGWCFSWQETGGITLAVETPGLWGGDEHTEALKIECSLEQLEQLQSVVKEAIKVAKWDRDNPPPEEPEQPLALTQRNRR